MPPRLRDLFHFEFPNDGGSGATAPVPGTGETTPDTPVVPPAEASPTEPPQRDLGPIPYSRFKEVNDARRTLEDQLQPYVDLEAVGYGVDDLHRLTQWEREFVQDPVQVWLRTAETIEGLPDSVKAAIAAANGGEAPKATSEADPTTPPSTPEDKTPQPNDDEPPEWAKPLIEDHQKRQTAETQAALDGTLDAIVTTWEKLDEQQGIKSPSKRQLFRYIQTATSTNPTEILREAREAWLEDREELLAAEVRTPGREGTVPRSVPGSGAGATGAPPVQPRTLREATKLALAAEESRPR